MRIVLHRCQPTTNRKADCPLYTIPTLLITSSPYVSNENYGTVGTNGIFVLSVFD